MMDRTARVLANVMQDREISQADLARATGVNQSTISRMLNPQLPRGIKTPSDLQVRPIANFLGLSTDQLRGYEPLITIHAGPGINSVELPEPWDVWFQHLSQIKDPKCSRALRNIVTLFADGTLSSNEATLLEQIARRLTPASCEAAQKR
jgi:transcriptional regulator with XRE-family HTH domain